MLGKPAHAAAGFAALVVLAAGCATQKVSLACVPKDVQIYVDGRELERNPEQLKLGVGEPHTLYFKGGGFQPQMVVLDSQETDGKRGLTNADLCERLVFTEVSPEVHIEVAPDDLPRE